MDARLCRAIAARVLLEFDYDGLHRIVQPYCHGDGASGELLRAIQVGGASRSAKHGFGKLWLVEKMTNLIISDEEFSPDDPDYNPNDRGMKRIHCRV